ncbi:ankyrin repeat domain-containing protein EMB506, chloroplastic-like isoform X4 [Primulina eburnea]|uniref:ankyrin repeat domain-containing protein EMB506, chloroplastic-like isoform X4 n=1 Tax=Primulina eburnea TaxID=1245227 RepID=UPI003C6C69E2
MIVSLGNAMLCPKQQLSSLPASVATAARPVFGCRFSYARGVMCFPNGNAHITNRYLKRMVYSVSKHGGLWEDPDYGSDDSEYEDAAASDDENEDMQGNELDNESDWEAAGNPKTAKTKSTADELSAIKYEEDLVKEVEQLLRPEEREILDRNKAPNIDKLSTAKWKPFHTLALAGQIKFVDGMLENNFDMNLVDMDGMTALHHAVVGKREAVISHLLRRGANPEAKDLEGWTPLHVAMQTRNRDIAKILLVNGADKTRRNKDGNTPLDLSLCYGKDFKSYDMAKLLKQVPANRSL